LEKYVQFGLSDFQSLEGILFDRGLGDFFVIAKKMTRLRNRSKERKAVEGAGRKTACAFFMTASGWGEGRRLMKRMAAAGKKYQPTGFLKRRQRGRGCEPHRRVWAAPSSF